jgi:hypothetical protein
VNLGYEEVDTMIRAVVKNGVIQPLDPLPAEWKEGREVVVDDLAEQLPSESDEFDRWSEDMKILTAELNNLQEWQEIEATLAEANRQNKALVGPENSGEAGQAIRRVKHPSAPGDYGASVIMVRPRIP